MTTARPEPEAGPGPGAVGALAVALFASGAAALTNQVVWQRALKSFLGGSETVASMLVVLVFMAGLGAGSLVMGRRAAGIARPVLALGWLEAGLGAVNLAVCAVLLSDLDRSVRHVQALAVASGIPLLPLYGAGSAALLFVPTFLMGATLPLASESCQRVLGFRSNRVLPWLFFVNTLGSAAGSLAGSFYLVPAFGQGAALRAAAAANLAAGLALLALARGRPAAAPAERHPGAGRPLFPPTPEEALSLGLGFASLAYEMALFRIAVVRLEPRPFVFAAVLTGYLLYWSLGTWVAPRLGDRWRLGRVLGLTAAWLLLIPVFTLLGPRTPLDRLAAAGRFLVTGAGLLIPAALFGILFGLLLVRAAARWGEDVGRLSAYNTAGACLGTVAATFVGYEMDWLVLPMAIGLVVFALRPLVEPGASRALAAAALAVAVGSGAGLDLSERLSGGRADFFFGADGQITVFEGKNMIWDGLWHSALSDGRSHIGTRNWYLATAPVMAHPSGRIRDACVIGLGTGITAATLAKLDSVSRVVAYDITTTLREVLEAYPGGTLGALENPKLEIRWEDARMGLALRPGEKFDLIQAQPLYLMQAGSGLLNSVEFYRLVADRLRPGGVFCLYTNGTPGQAYLARQTAAAAFAHGESFLSGYLLVLSNEPLRFDLGFLREKAARFADDPLWREIRAHPETRDPAAQRTLFDSPRLPWGDGSLLTTDDHPRVEYPRFIDGWIRGQIDPETLPHPGSRTRAGGRIR